MNWAFLWSSKFRMNENLTGLDKANGQRLRAIPELALPMRALWGFSRPSVSLDYTRYELDDYTLGDAGFDRTVPVFEWDNGLYFDRRSSLFDVPYNQTLEPRLYYAWADAESDQNYIPDFDTGIRSFRFDQLFRRDRFTGGERPIHKRGRPGGTPKPVPFDFHATIFQVNSIRQRRPGLAWHLLKGPVVVTSNHNFMPVRQCPEPIVEVFDVL